MEPSKLSSCAITGTVLSECQNYIHVKTSLGGVYYFGLNSEVACGVCIVIRSINTMTADISGYEYCLFT